MEIEKESKSLALSFSKRFSLLVVFSPDEMDM